MSIQVLNVQDRLEDVLHQQDLVQASEILSTLDAGTLARIIDRLDPPEAAVAFRLIRQDQIGYVFEKLDPPVQSEIIEHLHDAEVTRLFVDLEAHERVALIDELPAELARELWSQLDSDEVESTATIMGYPTGSVARWMTTRMVVARVDDTVGEVLPKVDDGLADAEMVYVIPVVDSEDVVQGILSLRNLLQSRHDLSTPTSQIIRQATLLPATMSAEEAAQEFSRTGALALPVVDHGQHLLGMVTIDDAVRILEDEIDEDVARAGGAEPLRQPYLRTSVRQLFQSRIIWLFALAVSALFTVQVLDAFQDELAKVIVLSLFIPLLVGIGGNTGNQAATTVTRAIALGDVHMRDIGKVALHENAVGFCLGATLGSVGFVVASIIFGVDIGLVIGLTIVAICTLAATVGGIMPIIGKRLGIDPAVFSNPFISTFCDASGLLIYFLIAKLVLGI
ncbi:MAG: magnesium transporter [Candidatus Nanopelagicales bacterium]